MASRLPRQSQPIYCLLLPQQWGGRLLSQVLVGWVPGFGNVINASTAAALTEAIGWAADSYFAGAETKT